jgi:hypothetical protein
MNKKKITTSGLRGIINSFTLWKYIKAITTPFENTMAYRLGIIDAKGNYLKDPNKLTKQENNALTNFDVMIFNLKKLFDKIIDPSIKYKLKYIPTAIPLLAEEAERYGADGEFITEQLLAFIYENGFIIEEVENDFLIESEQTVGHLRHIGELLYANRSDEIVNHLKAIGDRLRGNPQKSHNLSIKADGVMSVLFGNRNGVPYAKYKGTGAVEFTSHEQLEKWAKTNGKPHYIEPIGAALTAAAHPKIENNVSYQADIIVGGRGNLVQYERGEKTSHQIAVHGKYDSDTGEKLESNPDMSHLSTETIDFPHLGISGIKELHPTSQEKLKEHISKASLIMGEEDVESLMEKISNHTDPTNKSGSRSAYLVRFSNAVQRGTHERSLEGFKKFTEDQMRKGGAADQKRYLAHYNVLSSEPAFERLLQAHDHIDKARDIIVDHVTRNVDSLKPKSGYGHEGIVSELDGNMIKLVPRSFSKANSEQRGKFKNKGAAVLYSGKFGTITDAHTQMSKEGIELARKLGATHFIHGPTTSEGHLLSHEEKTEILSNAVQEHIGNNITHSVTSPEATNPFKQIDELISKGHRTIHFIGGSDRITEPGRNNLTKSLQAHMTRNGGKWETESGKLIGLNLKFHQVGETRKSGSDGLSGVSGTRLREAIQGNNREGANNMMPRHMSEQEKDNYHALLANRMRTNPLKESILSNLLRFLQEEGEAVQASPIINSVSAGGIAGIGQDATEGNIVVRKRPPILRRKKKK